jgi:hypothetical protein
MDEEETEPQEFEEKIAALLKVDPKGLSGKHRKDPEPGKDEDPEGQAPGAG